MTCGSTASVFKQATNFHIDNNILNKHIVLNSLLLPFLFAGNGSQQEYFSGSCEVVFLEAVFVHQRRGALCSTYSLTQNHDVTRVSFKHKITNNS